MKKVFIISIICFLVFILIIGSSSNINVIIEERFEEIMDIDDNDDIPDHDTDTPINGDPIDDSEQPDIPIPPSFANYTIFTNGTMFFVFNNDTNSMEYNDTSASILIQKTIDDANTSYGLVIVYVRSGEYPISVAIKVKSNIHLIGAGNTTIFKIQDNTDIDAIVSGDYPDKGNCDNIILENFKIDGNGENQEGCGSNVIYGGENILIRNLYIDDMYGTAILFKQVTDSLIEDCYITDSVTADGICIYDGTNRTIIRNNIVSDLVSNSAFGIYILGREWAYQHDCINNIVIGNEVLVAGIGIALRCGAYNNTVAENIVKNCYGNGIEIFGQTIDNMTLNCKFNLISKNEVHDNGQGDGIYAGIKIWDDGIEENGCTNNTISENVVSGQEYGIYEIGCADYNLICNNDCRNNFNQGIRVESDHTIVRDNLT